MLVYEIVGLFFTFVKGFSSGRKIWLIFVFSNEMFSANVFEYGCKYRLENLIGNRCKEVNKR